MERKFMLIDDTYRKRFNCVHAHVRMGVFGTLAGNGNSE
jgi:hypothetical protein